MSLKSSPSSHFSQCWVETRSARSTKVSGWQHLLKRTKTLDENTFQDWKFRAETNMRAVLLDGTKVLTQNKHATGDIEGNGLEGNNVDVNVDKILFYFLAAACMSEAFDIVCNVRGGLGAEAWRRLCRRYRAKIRGKKVVLLIRCVHPPKVKQLADVPGLIEKWEGEAQHLSADFQERLSGLLEIMPAAVAEFMTLRKGEDGTYHDTNEAILRYVQVMADLWVGVGGWRIHRLRSRALLAPFV